MGGGVAFVRAMGCVKMNGGSMENENRGITTMLLKNAADGADPLEYATMLLVSPRSPF